MYRYQLFDVKTILEGYKEFELIPNGRSQKSFYRKATVIETSKGTFLQSYETIVAMIDKQGNFHRMWNGWSATTAKHVDSFRRLFGMTGICKKDWIKLEVMEGI